MWSFSRRRNLIKLWTPMYSGVLRYGKSRLGRLQILQQNSGIITSTWRTFIDWVDSCLTFIIPCRIWSSMLSINTLPSWKKHVIFFGSESFGKRVTTGAGWQREAGDHRCHMSIFHLWTACLVHVSKLRCCLLSVLADADFSASLWTRQWSEAAGKDPRAVQPRESQARDSARGGMYSSQKS